MRRRRRCGAATAALKLEAAGAVEPVGWSALSDVEFAALMAVCGPFAGDRRVVVAVSGGADSMALAFLLSHWGRPVACVVDHGLRAEAADEAARTVARLAGLGVPARVMRADVPPGASVAARAREARYGLLVRACREAGCADLVVAHHADDQAETVRMRQGAGSSSRGLAGMAAVSYKDEVRLLRPLLAVRGARLRATVAAAGLDWEEDPTNQDPRTLRARLRASADERATGAALRDAAGHGLARREMDRRVVAELAGVAVFPEGYALAPPSVGPAGLAALVWTISGRGYPPGPGLTDVAALALHGVLVRPAGRLGPGWLVAREPNAVAMPVPAREGAVWDGRFRLQGDLGRDLTFGALGDDAARFRHLSPLPSVVLRTLPTLRQGAGVVIIPHLAFPDVETCRSVPVWFCPARPVSGAPFFPAAINPCERMGGA